MKAGGRRAARLAFTHHRTFVILPSASAVFVGAIEDVLDLIELLEDGAGAPRDGGERVFGDAHLQAGLALQDPVNSSKQGAAAREDDAAIDQVGCEFRFGISATYMPTLYL